MSNAKASHDSETTAQGQQVITACALIHHEFDGVTKIFMPRRTHTKKFLPGVFELPGGHIDFNENIVEGLKREIHEEFGMRVKIGDPFAAFDYSNHVKGSHSVEIVYFATFADPLEQIKLDPADHSEFGWFAENELNKVTTPGKGQEDPEFNILRKAFELLKGQSLNTGT